MNRRLAAVLAPALLAPLLVPVLAALPAGPATAADAPAPAASAAAVVRAAVPASFVLTGGGWGHGVGMSQYGAQAQALAGRSAATILAFYYRGSAVSAVRDDADLRVQVLGGARSVRLSTRSLAGRGGGGFTVRVGGLDLAGDAGDTLTLTSRTDGTPGVRAVVTPAAAPPAPSSTSPAPPRLLSASGATALVRWQGTRALRGGATVVTVPGSGGTYRHGTLEVAPLAGRLNVVNTVRLHDEYLAGIAEVPASWAPAALQAQAMAARTYAVRALAAGVRRSCGCHLYDTTTSQVFAGWKREGEPTWGARWSAAVRATAPSPTTGNVVTYQGKPIEALYFSSDGGRTENSEDVWSAAVPYLRSVADPWSAGGGNPLAVWTRTVSQARVAAAFGLPDVASLDLSDRTAGGSVRTAVAVSSTGAAVRVSAGRFVGRLGLPARWLFRSVERVGGGAGDAAAWPAALSVAFRPGAPVRRTAVVVDAAQVWDGVSAAPLARRLGAALVAVPPGVRGSALVAELKAREVTSVVLVGAIARRSLRVAVQAAGMRVRRVAGANVAATSALVAAEVLASGGTRSALVVPTSTPDGALAAAAVAAGAGRPVLLVRPGTAPTAAAAVLRSARVTSSVCVGSVRELPEALRRALPGCTRVSGADGASLSAALAGAVRGPAAWRGLTVVSVAPGMQARAVAALALGQPMVRVGTRATGVTVRWLQRTPAVGTLAVVGPVPAAAVLTLQRS